MYRWYTCRRRYNNVHFINVATNKKIIFNNNNMMSINVNMYAYYMCQCTHTYMYLACIHVPQNMVLCVCTVPHMHYDYTVYTVMHKYSKCKKKPDRFYTHVCTPSKAVILRYAYM